MKIKSIVNNIFALTLFGACVGMTSCDDFLTLSPSNKITEEDFWQSKSDLDNVRASVYRQMASSDVTSRIIYWGEMRSDNVSLYDMSQTNLSNTMQGILMPTNGMFSWSAFYTGINYCNLVLEQGEAMTTPGSEVDPSFRRNDWLPIKAEMLAMRALYYFYLVRAYRDVPYVTTPVRTDVEARSRKDGQTLGVQILGNLIADLDTEGEEAWSYAADNYGSSSENVGRFTKRGIHALLADMYLWRGCMLKNSEAKGDSVFVTEGDTTKRLTSAECTALSKECFHKAIAHCDSVLNYLAREYDEQATISGTTNTTRITNFTPLNQKFRYMTYPNVYGTGGKDNLYSSLFQNSNDDECIFVLKYDATSGITNSAPTTYFASSSNGGAAALVTGSSILASSATNSYEATRGFGKSDFRLHETLKYSTNSTSLPMLHKHMISSLSITNYEDMTEGAEADYSSQNEQNWNVYRLPDIMLIKAEAIARLEPANASSSDTQDKKGNESLWEGFDLVNAVFARSNPKLQASETFGTQRDLQSDRLHSRYPEGKSASDLLTLVYNERQREFVEEGKRWFDIVRQCEAKNDNSDVLTNFITVSTTVRNRLRQLYSVYVPIYTDEIKVNGVDYGGNLRQNPVWDRYTTK